VWMVATLTRVDGAKGSLIWSSRSHWDPPSSERTGALAWVDGCKPHAHRPLWLLTMDASNVRGGRSSEVDGEGSLRESRWGK
jgi:hypothetical protein